METVVIQKEAGDTTSTAAVVQAKEIVRRYGEGDTAVHALRGVSVDVARGKLTAVMGPSGSGKSTLMHILAGLDQPTEGEVWIAGTQIGPLSDTDLTKLRREHIGFIFQFFNLLPMLTAKENVVLPLSLAGEKPDRAWVDELTTGLERGQLEALLEREHGLRLRTPLIAKETAAGAIENIDGRIKRLVYPPGFRWSGQTTVMVTHDAHAAAIADRVLFLADGQIVKDLGPSTAIEILQAMEEVSPR